MTKEEFELLKAGSVINHPISAISSLIVYRDQNKIIELFADGEAEKSYITLPFEELWFIRGHDLVIE